MIKKDRKNACRIGRRPQGDVQLRLTSPCGRRPVYLLVSLILLSFFFFPSSSYANGLTVSSVKLTDRNTTSQTINVQFTVTWSNAWKDEINNDAVWIFVKYSTDGGSTWYHATLTTASYTPTGSAIIIPPDQKGAFIQPANYGSGTQTYTGVKLLWAYGLDGVSDANVISGSSQIKVFGIEMVYIPQSGFYAGDGANTYSEFKQGYSDTKPWFIPNENAIHVTNIASGGYYYVTDVNGSNDDATGSDFWIPQDYPKGYKAFYLMKYEISEGQWVEFLKTLTSTQKASHDITDGTNGGKSNDSVWWRNTVDNSSGTFATYRSDRACTFLSWPDLMAYAGWSGLRPMSELEFEKAARGPNTAVSGEYTWGSTSITQCASTSSTDGTETCGTGGANLTYGGVTFGGGGYDWGQGTLRCGAFATGSTTTRAASGAGFYGNLDLSGSVWEKVVTVGNSTGRAFVGSHGDGVLSSSGYATNADWPGYSGSEVTASLGSGARGGSWASDAPSCRISCRSSGGYAVTVRDKDYGGRFARTAP